MELKAILEKFFSNYTAAEAMKMMQDNSIPCGPLCTVDEACENPSILARKMLVEIDQPGMGKVKITGNPMKLSETPPTPATPPRPWARTTRPCSTTSLATATSRSPSGKRRRSCNSLCAQLK